ncbi:MAG TPA: FtsX-like permease family protein, partial [Opitutus sp.]|nr:FtsX-like permease family protein [Opitutus sp.]
IVLGVGLFVVTQATTSGFEDFFIKTILGTDGAITIQDRMQDTMRSMAAGGEGSQFMIRQKEGRKYISGIEEPKLVSEALAKFSNVSGTSAVLTGAVTIRSSLSNESVRVFGINFDDHVRVSDLETQITHGDAAVFRSTDAGAILGSELAARSQLSVGDSFILEATGEQRRYRVSAIFKTGVSEIDRTRVFLHMSEARSLLRRPTGASFIQVNLIDKDRAVEDAAHMSEVLKHLVRPWQVREETWLEVFRALRISTAITVSVFTLIAGLAMFNTLAMIVLEKTKEIAILRSMGYTRKDISQIFLWQAVIVLAIGTAVGCLLGAGITYGISNYPIRIRGIFATNTFIVAWSVWHYVAAITTAVTMVMIASLVPARRAALLEPGDVIRGTAQ